MFEMQSLHAAVMFEHCFEQSMPILTLNTSFWWILTSVECHP